MRVLSDSVGQDDELRRELRDALADVGAIDEPGPEPPAYTAESLAAAIGLSPKSIRNAIARGELQAVKRAGRWIIPADAVNAWLETPRPATPRRGRARPDSRARPLHAALRRR